MGGASLAAHGRMVVDGGDGEADGKRGEPGGRDDDAGHVAGRLDPVPLGRGQRRKTPSYAGNRLAITPSCAGQN